MKCVEVAEAGGVDKLQYVKRPIPELLPGHVLIKNQLAGLNFIDTYFRKGLYPKPMPFTLGVEGGGVVEKIADDVTSNLNGKKVAYYSFGSYAEYSVVPEKDVVVVPDGEDIRHALYFMVQGLTAHYLARSTFELKPGTICVILAAGGGVGQLLTQIAKLKGAQVIAVTSEKKRASVEAFGPDFVCNYEEYQALAKSLGGAHVVYDSVGQETWEKSMLSLRPRGMLVLYGNASGPVPPVDPLLLAKHGSLFVTRPTLASYVLTAEERQWRFDELYSWTREGSLSLPFDDTFPLSAIQEVHSYLERGESKGKILLDVTQ